MLRSKLSVLVGLAFSLVAVDHLLAQPTWNFTRVNDPNQVQALAAAGARVLAPFEFNGDGENNIGDILEFASASTSASNENAQVVNQSVAEAVNLTPLGGTTFVPTVDTTASQSQILTSTLPSRADTIEGTIVLGSSSADFLLDGLPESGFLHGGMYLVGLVSRLETGDGLFAGGATVSASIDQYQVEASYNDGTNDWTIEVDLPGFNQTITAGGVNNYFEFTVPVALPYTATLSASSEGTLVGGVNDGSAQAIVDLSASAWATFTPTAAPPPDGDFNGDLIVDGRDFLALQRGFGETEGATLTQGDANHDGMVDSTDIGIWNSNYGGQSLNTLAIAVQIPEPGTLVLAGLAGLGLMMPGRRQRRD